MKKLRTILIFNSIVYWSIYLIKTFIIWEFNNPFQWIIDLNIYSETNRFLIIFYILFIIGVEIAIAKYAMNNEGKIT